MSITIVRLDQFLTDLWEQYQREEDQAIMQRNMDKAVTALAGKEALTRIKSNLGMRVEMDENVARAIDARRRA